MEQRPPIVWNDEPYGWRGWRPYAYWRSAQLRQWMEDDDIPIRPFSAWWLRNDRGFQIGRLYLGFRPDVFRMFSDTWGRDEDF